MYRRLSPRQTIFTVKEVLTASRIRLPTCFGGCRHPKGIKEPAAGSRVDYRCDRNQAYCRTTMTSEDDLVACLCASHKLGQLGLGFCKRNVHYFIPSVLTSHCQYLVHPMVQIKSTKHPYNGSKLIASF